MNSREQSRDLAIKNNFDVSVILPFYKKLEVFKITIKRNQIYYQRNGIEVIIVMDEPSEQAELLLLIKEYPFINWKILVNERPHSWRNPAKAINVGIKNATKKYILVMGPDSEMATDIIFTMRKMSSYYANCFFTGKVAFVDYDFTVSESQLKTLSYWSYGSIFIKREYLLQVGGYDENYESWGGDDDNIRARLQMLGLKKMNLYSSILIHRERKDELESHRKREKNSFSNRGLDELRHSFYPGEIIANNNFPGGWGNDFEQNIYDWNKNIYAREICISYINKAGFEKFNLHEQAFKNNHKIVALVSAYNEEKLISDSLRHLEKYCDGIILLDDCSTDNTYVLAQSEKLLLKCRKRERNGFNDLLNRNLLLNLAFFFQTEFYFFMDVDERFDERYSDLYTVAKNTESDTICFYLVHLWDRETDYRVDIPEPSPINEPGIIHRWRMFKNIGRMQIAGNKLHFEAVPYRSKRYIAPILIQHFGMLNEKNRSLKYTRYKMEDENLKDRPDKYEYFLDYEVEVKPISEITLPESQ